MSEMLDDTLRRLGWAGDGDLVVVVTSTRPTIPGETDTVHVHRVSLS
jgi:hypothetical protein